MSDERGVSDVVGFVIVFALAVALIGTLSVGALSAFDDRRDGEQARNAERAFEVLATGFEDVQQGRSESSVTEIALSGGTLATTDETTISIEIDGADDPDPIRPKAIEYELDGTEIRYEAGALFRSERSGAVMLYEPAFNCSADHTAVISVVTLDTGNTSRVSGERSVRIVGREDREELLFPTDRSNTKRDVTLTVHSPRSNAWGRYLELEENDWEPVKRQEDTYRCPDVRRVYVRQVHITLRFV